MDKQYLMQNNCVLIRSATDNNEATFLSHQLRSRLIRIAMMEAFKFYSKFFNELSSTFDYDKLMIEYEQDFSDALSLGLFKPGGIREKDHLNLWCLGHIFAPEIYIESGVFIGSSLHAFIKSPKLKKVIGIDPNLSNLKIPKIDIPGAELISDRDFSQIEIGDALGKTLVYFDDHISAAERILQASQKGIKYLLFDDATGFEGMCHRLYPAVPSVPMIMNSSLFEEGDRLAWTFKPKRPSRETFPSFIKRTLLGRSNNNLRRVSFSMTHDLINQCHEAKRLIKKCCKIPDLGDYIPELYPERKSDTSKFLIELHD